MKHYKILLASIALAPVASMAAEDLSYTYLQGEYINLDIDDVGDDGNVIDDFDNGNGFALRGSYGFSNNIFVFANYSSTDADVAFFDDLGVLQPADTEVKKFDIGLGYALPVNDASDVVFRAAYTDMDFGDFDLGATDSDALDDLNDDTSDGYIVDASWRTQLTSIMELSLGGRYTDIENTDGLSFIGSVLFELTPNFGLLLAVDAGDELGTYSAGVRYSF